jgi:hypothetical protein
MASGSYFGKLATFISGERKPALVPFGLFNAQDNLAFVAGFPTQNQQYTVGSTAYASALVIDSIAFEVNTITLTGNVASTTLNYGGSPTVPQGWWVILRFVQDATGGRTVVLPTNLIVDSGFVIDPTALRATILPIQYDSVLAKWKFFSTAFSVPTA